MSSAAPLQEHLTNISTKGDYDSELGLSGGANLARQMSVNLTAEQFERLYLQPGGQMAKGDLSKRLGNPTPLGVVSFLLCLTPLSCDLMGWTGASAASAVTLSGSSYLIGGVGLYLAGILEFILGNTFPFVVFCSFGGFWSAYGFFIQPTQAIAEAAGGATTIAYNNGFAIYLLSWAAVTLIYLIASLRTNVVFVLLFFFLEITFDVLVLAYLRLGYGELTNVAQILKVAGAFGFLTAAMGWYLLIVLMLGTTGIPLALPVGDLSGFLSGKPAVRKD